MVIGWHVIEKDMWFETERHKFFLSKKQGQAFIDDVNKSLGGWFEARWAPEFEEPSKE